MQPEEATQKHNPLTLWSANRRLQTYFSPAEGSSEVVAEPSGGSEPLESHDLELQPTEVSESEQTPPPVEPEVDDETWWRQHLESLPENRRKQFNDFAAERAHYKREYEVGRRASEMVQTRPQPQTNQSDADQQLDDFLATEHDGWMKATIAASKAMEKGDEVAYRKANAQAARHMLKINSVREVSIIQNTLAIQDAKSRPHQIQQGFEAQPEFAPIKEAAPGFAMIEHLLVQAGMPAKDAHQLVGDTAFATLAGTKKHSSNNNTVSLEERQRAKNRARSEPPDGGGSATGGGQGAEDFDKASAAFWRRQFA